MKDYILTIKVPINELDDVEARKCVMEKKREMNTPEEAELKLQEIFANKPPRKVELK